MRMHTRDTYIQQDFMRLIATKQWCRLHPPKKSMSTNTNENTRQPNKTKTKQDNTHTHTHTHTHRCDFVRNVTDQDPGATPAWYGLDAETVPTDCYSKWVPEPAGTEAGAWRTCQGTCQHAMYTVDKFQSPDLENIWEVRGLLDV